MNNAKDNLEQFIIDNKSAWDNKLAPKHLWRNIEGQLRTDSRATKIPWKTITFILVLLIASLIGYIISERINNPDESPPELLEYAELSNFSETEQYYLSAIHVSQQELGKRHIDATLDEDLSLLDVSTQLLKEEYKNVQGPYREKVLRSIILNHKIKLQILDRVLSNIQGQETITHDEIY